MLDSVQRKREREKGEVEEEEEEREEEGLRNSARVANRRKCLRIRVMCNKRERAKERKGGKWEDPKLTTS